MRFGFVRAAKAINYTVLVGCSYFKVDEICHGLRKQGLPKRRGTFFI